MENYTDRRNCIKHKKIPARTVKLSWQVFYFESPSQSTDKRSNPWLLFIVLPRLARHEGLRDIPINIGNCPAFGLL